MTGHPYRVRTLPSHLAKPSTAPHAVISSPVSYKSRVAKYTGRLLVALAFVGSIVPVVILAMHTAQYVFGW
jgi:hypothetical protein